MEERDKTYSVSISDAVDEINEKKAKGEKIHPLTEEGLKAIDFANSIVSTIIKRNKPDLAYFKIYMESTNSRISKMSGIEASKTAPQKQGRKSLKKRRSNRINNRNKAS